MTIVLTGPATTAEREAILKHIDEKSERWAGLAWGPSGSSLKYYVARALHVTERRIARCVDEMAAEGVLIKVGHGQGQKVWRRDVYWAAERELERRRALQDRVVGALKTLGIESARAEGGRTFGHVSVATADLARLLGVPIED